MHVDLSAYVGKWVALTVDNRVAGVGNTAKEAAQLARRNRSKDRFVLRFVAPILTNETGIAELWEGLRPLLTQHPQPIYLVGGAVRDLLLDRPGHDLDFVVSKDAIRLTFAVADQLGVPAYPLDRKRDTGRVILADNQTTLDFARFRGDTLEDDLRDRDFTINAMALPITAVSTSPIIDPCGGLADLKAKRIHLTHEGAIQQDPVRALRAIRLELDLEFTLSPETETAVMQTAPHLDQVSKERIRDELLKLLSSSAPDKAAERMEKWGVLKAVLPEMAQLTDVAQSLPHHEPVFAHTVSVLRWLAQIENTFHEQQPLPAHPALLAVQTMLAPFVEEIRTHLNREEDGGVSGWICLRLGALFHDIGKGETQTVDENGRIRFLTHEKVGAQMAAKWLRTYCLSNKVIDHVKWSVLHHMRPLSLLIAGTPGKLPSRRAIYRFFRDAHSAGIDVGLITMADYLATHNGFGSAEEWMKLLAIVESLFTHYFHHFTETVSPIPLLSGQDLMQLLQLSPGPEIGRLLRLITEAQAAGELNSREEARQFARNAVQ